MVRNRIFRALPPKTRTSVLGHCTHRTIETGSVLSRAGAVLETVHFPETGVISALSTFSDGSVIEVANIGLDGCTGVSLALGTKPELTTNVVQISGASRTMNARDFGSLMDTHPDFRAALFGAVQGTVYQVMISGACNATHSAKQRLARWLLTMNDRSPGQDINLTHDFLAQILGVRRATVSLATAELTREGCIDCGRGRITITDRQALQRASCECYDLVREAYDTLLPYGDA